jgi:cell volume regulation protein A
MPLFQPTSLPITLIVLAVLMLGSALLGGASHRAGVPIVLAVLALGLAAGSGGLTAVLSRHLGADFNFGTVALLLILFDGGLNTPLGLLSSGLFPALLLATLGVVITATVVGLCAHWFGFPWTHAFLLGAIVAPTDAAAVFPILRGSGLQLKKRVGTTLELESGLNDPVAVTLTLALTQNLFRHHALTPAPLLAIPCALLIGGAMGLAIGYGGRLLLSRVSLPAGGLYPIVTLALALFAFGAPALLLGSGFLAVYAAALIIGNGALPYRGGILRVHDAAAWLCQIALYLLLGALALPAELLRVAPVGVALALFLALIARPFSVALCLLPFRYPPREIVYIGWIGLRGAVPIVLAIYPVLAGVDGARSIFNLIFFIVAVSTIIPGATVRWMTAALRLKADEPSPPPAVLEIISTRVLTGAEILSFTVSKSSAACGAQISDLPLPADATVVLLIRDRELIPPRGATALTPGDHVYVLCRPEDRALVHLLFGRAESD